MNRSGEDVLKSDDAVRTAVSGYERPTLVLVGNLNDLLAGTASKDQDNVTGMQCTGTGDDINPGGCE